MGSAQASLKVSSQPSQFCSCKLESPIPGRRDSMPMLWTSRCCFIMGNQLPCEVRWPAYVKRDLFSAAGVIRVNTKLTPGAIPIQSSSECVSLGLCLPTLSGHGLASMCASLVRLITQAGFSQLSVLLTLRSMILTTDFVNKMTRVKFTTTSTFHQSNVFAYTSLGLEIKVRRLVQPGFKYFQPSV